MKRPYEWPSRERWAEQHQHPYFDGETGCPFADRYSHHLSDYATPEEVAVLTTALKNLYRELGRKLQAVNLRGNPSNQQQRGEGQSAWYARFRQLPPEDQELFRAAGNLRFERSAINDLPPLTRVTTPPSKPGAMRTSANTPHSIQLTMQLGKKSCNVARRSIGNTRNGRHEPIRRARRRCPSVVA
jgi:hypothetical protein